MDRGGRKLAVATQGPGSVLGEMSMLTGRARSATVTALTDGEALRIRRETVAKAVEEHPRLSSLFYRNLARILAERLRVASFWINASPPL
jgi:CRP-like cAMP-binding protein